MKLLLARPFGAVYAQIDLKNATILIRDGYDGPGTTNGAVNNAAGYMLGATTMVVDGYVGAVITGDRFTVDGDTIVHTITAHTETLSNTTEITFTPALGAAVVDNAVITILPHHLEVKIGEGNCTYTEKRNMTYTRDRGTLDTVKEGDEEPMDVRIDATWEFLRSSTGQTPTIEDVLKQRGEASTWVSSSADPCEPYCVDIEILYQPPCGGEEDEKITLPDFRWEQIEHDLRQGQISVTGKCNAKEANITRGEFAV